MHGERLEDGPLDAGETAGLIWRRETRQPGRRKRSLASTGGVPAQQVIERGAQARRCRCVVSEASVAAVLFQRRVGDGAAPLHDGDRAAIVGLQDFDKAEVDQFDRSRVASA